MEETNMRDFLLEQGVWEREIEDVLSNFNNDVTEDDLVIVAIFDSAFDLGNNYVDNVVGELDHHIDCFFTGRAKKATRLYTGKELENWIYWEDTKKDELLPTGNWYNEYMDGMSIEPVTKNYYLKMPGSLEIGVLKDNQIHPVGFLSGLEDEVKENYPSYAMKPIEVTCMMFTPDGNLRHAKLVRMRDDLTVQDCTWDKYISENN